MKMRRISRFFKKNRWIILGSVVTLGVLAFLELHGGRSFFGPDGTFGIWDGNINGSENSQRLLDAYSFTHIIHGILIYALLWLVARKVPARYRFLAAVIIAAGWELLENSPLIINRYRAETISHGYVGDSVLNSMSDVIMMAIGFGIARFKKVWMTITLVVAIELELLSTVRDNLTINIIMLVHPVESIKTWQAAAIPEGPQRVLPQ